MSTEVLNLWMTLSDESVPGQRGQWVFKRSCCFAQSYTMCCLYACKGVRHHMNDLPRKNRSVSTLIQNATQFTFTQSVIRGVLEAATTYVSFSCGQRPWKDRYVLDSYIIVILTNENNQFKQKECIFVFLSVNARLKLTRRVPFVGGSERWL